MAQKKILKIKKKIILPQNLWIWKNIIELDLTRLNRELIYEIHEIARNAHNPNEKNNKKLVLKVISAGSCLLYHTDFIISDSIVEEISNKYA